jgi:hypothetical protein
MQTVFWTGGIIACLLAVDGALGMPPVYCATHAALLVIATFLVYGLRRIWLAADVAEAALDSASLALTDLLDEVRRGERGTVCHASAAIMIANGMTTRRTFEETAWGVQLLAEQAMRT